MLNLLYYSYQTAERLAHLIAQLTLKTQFENVFLYFCLKWKYLNKLLHYLAVMQKDNSRVRYLTVKNYSYLNNCIQKHLKQNLQVKVHTIS